MPADPRPTVLRDALGHIRVIAPLPATLPLVTVIIPTRDRVHLLRPCVEGVCRAEYANLEILIVDNASQCRKTRRYLAAVLGDRRISILALPGSFNFAALNNAAVRVARGQILAFLNNDVQCMETGWLMEMVSHAVRPEIGAVGAKLLYPEGSVQHAGVILGLGGLAGHAHRFFPADHLGYMRRLQTAQYVSAVTAACMVLERKKFTEVGGFDEKTFSVAYNDVDLCLKLRSRGYENFYTPYATLYHKESASRARDISRARRSAYARESHSFKARWQHMLATDPYYNPNLTLEKEDFSLR
jgi:GT2 family glycosyltransferase